MGGLFLTPTRGFLRSIIYIILLFKIYYFLLVFLTIDLFDFVAVLFYDSVLEPTILLWRGSGLYLIF